MPPDEGMLERLREAKALADGETDNLLRAIAALAAAGGMTIIPRPEMLASRPVIILPERMYDRLCALIAAAPPDGA